MKKLFTKFLNLHSKAFLTLALLIPMSFAVMAQSPYCDPYQTTSCSTYNMSVNGVDIKQGSTTLYNRAHSTGGGCGSSAYYTLWSS